MHIKSLSVSAGGSTNHVADYLNTFKHIFKKVPLKLPGHIEFALSQTCETSIFHELSSYTLSMIQLAG